MRHVPSLVLAALLLLIQPGPSSAEAEAKAENTRDTSECRRVSGIRPHIHGTPQGTEREVSAAIRCVALFDPDRAVRMDAIDDADEDTLLQVAREDGDAGLRVAAVRRIKSQQALAERLRLDDSPQVRLTAVERLTDAELLLRLAQEDEDEEVRLVAVQRLSDQSAFPEIARHDGNWRVRAAALARISDLRILAQVALGDPEPWLRSAAVSKVTDQVTLLDVARHDPDPGPRSLATHKLADAVALADIARHDVDPQVRRAAVDRIVDQGLLEEVARRDSNADTRWDALVRLTPGPWLRRMTTQPASNEVRLWDAVSQLLTGIPLPRDDIGRQLRIALAVVMVRLTTEDEALREAAHARFLKLLDWRCCCDPLPGLPSWNEEAPLGWSNRSAPALASVLHSECERSNAWACSVMGGLSAAGISCELGGPPPDQQVKLRQVEAIRLLTEGCRGGVALACTLAERVRSQPPSDATTRGVAPVNGPGRTVHSK